MFIDIEMEDYEEEDKSIKKDYPDYEPKDVMNIIMEKDEQFSDIFMEGTMKDYLERNIERLKAVEGEAEQMVRAVRTNNVPVWYLLADNEGHGFRRKANADYQFYAEVKFMESVLLK